MARGLGRINRSDSRSRRVRDSSVPKKGVHARSNNNTRYNDFAKTTRDTKVRKTSNDFSSNRQDNFNDSTRERKVRDRRPSRFNSSAEKTKQNRFNTSRRHHQLNQDNIENKRTFSTKSSRRKPEDNNAVDNNRQQAKENIFEKYLKNRENPLDVFSDLAGSKYKDVFKTSKGFFENPFEVKEDTGKASNIFEDFKASKDENNYFTNKKEDKKESSSKAERKHKFFNPFEGVKPSDFSEKQNPNDLFSFSRGIANESKEQPKSSFFNRENVLKNANLQQESQINQGSFFTHEHDQNVSPSQEHNQNANLPQDDEFDEVFEYETIVDKEESSLGTEIETNKIEDSNVEDSNEFYDHALIVDSKEQKVLEQDEDIAKEESKELESEETKKQETSSNEQDIEELEQEELSEETNKENLVEEEEEKTSVATLVSTILFSIFAVAFVAYMLFVNDVKKIDVKSNVEAVRPVKVFEVKSVSSSGAVLSSRVFPAQVVAFKDIAVSFKLSGKVKKVYVKEGDYVKKGQIVAKLDDVDYRYNIEKLEPSLKKAEEDYKRAQELFKEQVASKAYLETMEEAYFTAKRNYDYAKTQLAETVLKSPYSGTILTKDIEDQEFVNPGTVVVSMSNSNKVEVEAFFTERVMQAVVKSKDNNYNTAVSFSSSSDKLYKVSVSEFSSVIDPVTQSYRVKYTMNRPKNVDIFAGMIAYLHVDPKDNKKSSKKQGKATIAIPLSSVAKFNNKHFVWVVDENKTISKRFVELGNISSDSVTIKSGLKSGDTIVQAGVSYLKDGQKINILAD